MSLAVRQDCGEHGSEQGFLLIGLVVAVFLIALFLAVAAPTMARSLERDKEVESEHRAQQYVRAIHNYYMKFNSYPTSMEQLLSQNNQHFLRQQYNDPLTGGDYKLIHFGEAKTEVKGFFGEPLEGTMGGGSGALSGSASNMGTGLGASTISSGTSGTGATGGSSGGFSMNLGGSSSTAPTSTTGTTSTQTSGTSTDSGTGTGTLGGTSAAKMQGSKGMIVGVASNASGHGLVEWNGSTNIEDWEFLYDHRTWLLKQRVNILGGGGGAGGGGGFASGSSSTMGSSSMNGSSSSNGTNGSTNGSGFGLNLGNSGNSSSGSSSPTGSSSTQPQ